MVSDRNGPAPRAAWALFAPISENRQVRPAVSCTMDRFCRLVVPSVYVSVTRDGVLMFQTCTGRLSIWTESVAALLLNPQGVGSPAALETGFDCC
ncbi:hypothetical protein SAMN04488003_10671 [Loktanella fryxellensis]|uniref:Uncharacterized protein n=1 Tax=Loktanella fryxellensis TaxID=245187 RepID=A0A1H8C624_9RHOB|nr:hypothetical protein SAMN04488003_10671 [Loktanella fryxellensis]